MPVVIGSKFTGRPAFHTDSTTGTYWETLPAIEGDAALFQQLLLTKPKAKRKDKPKRQDTAVGTPE